MLNYDVLNIDKLERLHRFVIGHSYSAHRCCCAAVCMAQETHTHCDDCTIYSEAGREFLVAMCVNNNSLTWRYFVQKNDKGTVHSHDLWVEAGSPLCKDTETK